MTKTQSPASLHALPYKSTIANSKPVLTKSGTLHHAKPRRKGIYIASGLFVYAITTYAVYLYTSLNDEPSSSSLPRPNANVSSRYDTTASSFDTDISFIERVTGINRLRKRLVAQAQGDVLEVCVGTGRNAAWYDMRKVKSLTFVDQSGPMVEIARRKWRELHPHPHPKEVAVTFLTQPLTSPLPKSSTDRHEDFTSIIQTMGICSTPDPSAALAHLGRLAHPTEARILLLEHGRSHYSWINTILDKSAARHAEKHGCWYNRDIGKVVAESGLQVEKVERRQFGTLWYVEARPPQRERNPGGQDSERDG